MAQLIIGDRVKLTAQGLSLWKDSATNPANGSGKIFAIYPNSSYPFQVRWSSGKVNAYGKGELERVYADVQRMRFCVDAKTRGDVFIKTTGTVPMREVMKFVRTYQEDPDIPYIVLLKDDVQIRAWWRLPSGVWLKGGRLPETEQERKGRELVEEITYWSIN